MPKSTYKNYELRQELIKFPSKTSTGSSGTSGTSQSSWNQSKNSLKKKKLTFQSPPKKKLKTQTQNPFYSSTSKSKLVSKDFAGHWLLNEKPAVHNDPDRLGIEKLQGKPVKPSSPIRNYRETCLTASSNRRKSSDRLGTPSYHVGKKSKKNTLENQILFPNEEPDDESDFDVSSTESRLLTVSPQESRKLKKIKLGGKANHSKGSRDSRMEPVEVIHDYGNYGTGLNATFEDSDSKISEDLESFHITPRYSPSDIEDDVTEESELKSVNNTSDYSRSVINDDVSEDSDSDTINLSYEQNEADLENKFDASECNGDTNQLNTTLDVRETIIDVKDMKLVVLPKNEKLYFHGLMSVTVLHGVVEVLGYSITTASDTMKLFSPRGSSLLYLESFLECSPPDDEEAFLDTLCTLGVNRKLAFEIYENMQLGSSVILCKRINEAEMGFVEKHISQKIFPTADYNTPRCFFNRNAHNGNVFKIGTEWDSLIDQIDHASKVFICGGKSVGKSTMLRYSINKLLQKYPEILLIDLDPGQPEFTVSGCVSASFVTEPVFGPSYTHLRKPHRCLFVPNIDIAFEPETYLKSVEEILQFCTNLSNMTPTLINYMGFTRGLGLDIFSAVVAYAQPTTLIQIESRRAQRNFKSFLSHSLISHRSKMLAGNIQCIPMFPIHTIQSMADTNQGWHLEPRQIREMTVLAYLSKMLPQDVTSLMHEKVQVLVIDLSLIKIMSNGEIVHPRVINANLVALCSPGNSSTCFKCHGWGVVRGIDLTNNQLFLLTPVPLDEVQQMDHLILGAVALPPSLYMTSHDNTSVAPFVSQGVLPTFGQIPKRSHLKKQRQG